jgi:XTP/dITP diphosphohydrolase
MKLLVATNNKGKVAELLRMFDLDGLELLTPTEAGLPADFDVEETGETFEENAVLKATAYAQASGLPALADDSGLAVDALNGEPGVYSKRYAGENATDAVRIAFLLDKLKFIPEGERTAQFVAVIALADNKGNIIATQEGICPGKVGLEPKGNKGFGYDPIFIPDEQDGRTLAELTAAEKDAISHRGRAVHLIKPTVVKLLGS